MNFFRESIVEDSTLEWFGEVVLVGRLREAIRRLNPAIPEEARELNVAGIESRLEAIA